tara:strand:- start:2012 stop:2530 length:519 start_codon:yes stop_codon:yes gene_type:complete
MILTLKQKLLISELIRIITTLIILYLVKIPIFAKIILIMLTDLIDCDISRLFINWIDCNSITYQKFDKITDSISYVLLSIYLFNNNNLSYQYYYLLLLLIYRLIGTYFFLVTNNRQYLFYFPNFFLEICLGLYVINYFPILNSYKKGILINIIIYKIIQEYFLHYNKKKIDI